MRDSELSGSPRRVQRIGEEQQRRRHGRMLRGEEARLAPAVGVAARDRRAAARRAPARRRRRGGPRGPVRRRPATAALAGAPGGTAGRTGAPRGPGRRAPRRARRAAGSPRTEPAPWVRTSPSTASPEAVEMPRTGGRPAARARTGPARGGSDALTDVTGEVAGEVDLGGRGDEGRLLRRRGHADPGARRGRRRSTRASPRASASLPIPRRSSASSPERSAPRRRWRFPARSAEAVPGLEREVWRGIVREVFAGAGAPAAFAPGAFDAYFDAVYRHFEDAAVWDVFPDVVPALERCAPRAARSASSATSTAGSSGSWRGWGWRRGSRR